MVAQPFEHKMTVQQWRDLERHSYGSKHEYIDGFVYDSRVVVARVVVLAATL